MCLNDIRYVCNWKPTFAAYLDKKRSEGKHYYLVKEKKENVISKQIIRSGTSIGANANEVIYGSSKTDFIAKLQILLKETAETEYWIRLLIKTDYISEQGGKFTMILAAIENLLISSIGT